jgi:hypothetical protein
MAMDDLDPYDGGASSIERRGTEPLGSYNPETGFSLNPSTLDELRWYTFLNRDPLDDESLLQSTNDD